MLVAYVWVLIYYENMNEETGELEDAEYSYSAASYADGVWRPEHLFTQSQRNRENPYWSLNRTEFSDSPNARGPGNKWKRVGDYKDERNLYDADNYSNSAEEAYEKLYDNLTPDDIYKQDLMAEHGYMDYEEMENTHVPVRPPNRKSRFSQGAQIPFWQSTVNTRHYERDPNGLREGGRSDRRVQSAAGYDMRTLTNRSSVEKTKIPYDKHYY